MNHSMPGGEITRHLTVSGTQHVLFLHPHTESGNSAIREVVAHVLEKSGAQLDIFESPSTLCALDRRLGILGGGGSLVGRWGFFQY